MHVFAKLIFLSSVQSLFCIHNFVPSYPGLKLYKFTFQYLHILTSFQTISSRQRFTHGVATLPKRKIFSFSFLKNWHTLQEITLNVWLIRLGSLYLPIWLKLSKAFYKKPCMNVKQQCTCMSMNSVNTRHTFLKNPDTLHKYANRHTFLKTQTLYTCRPIDTFFSRLKHFTPESQ